MARRRTFIPPVERVRDGYAFNIGNEERQLVTRLLNELSQLLVGESGDPRLVRMFPPAYHLADDAEADAEYQRLMREELVASRLSGITYVCRSIQPMTGTVNRVSRARKLTGRRSGRPTSSESRKLE